MLASTESYHHLCSRALSTHLSNVRRIRFPPCVHVTFNKSYHQLCSRALSFHQLCSRALSTHLSNVCRIRLSPSVHVTFNKSYHQLCSPFKILQKKINLNILCPSPPKQLKTFQIVVLDRKTDHSILRKLWQFMWKVSTFSNYGSFGGAFLWTLRYEYNWYVPIWANNMGSKIADLSCKYTGLWLYCRMPPLGGLPFRRCEDMWRAFSKWSSHNSTLSRYTIKSCPWVGRDNMIKNNTWSSMSSRALTTWCRLRARYCR